jgi:hypothetical protein
MSRDCDDITAAGTGRASDPTQVAPPFDPCCDEHHHGPCFDFCQERTDPYAMFARPRFQARDNAGHPLAGGTIAVYQGGTTTPMASYTSPSMSRPNPWPVVLDSGGWADIWWSGPAKIVCRDSLGNHMWMVDNYLGFGGWVCKRPSGSSIPSGTVLASDTDTTSGTLFDKLTASDGLAASLVTNSAGAQAVNISGQPILDELGAFETSVNGQISGLQDSLNGQGDDLTNLENEVAAIKVVSGDAGNIITAGSDNGAFLTAQTVENLVAPMIPAVPPATTLSGGNGITVTPNGNNYAVSLNASQMCNLIQATCPPSGGGGTTVIETPAVFSKAFTAAGSQTMEFTTTVAGDWRVRITASGSSGTISPPQFGSGGVPQVLYDQTIGNNPGVATREMLYSSIPAGTFTLTFGADMGAQYLVDVMIVGSVT